MAGPEDDKLDDERHDDNPDEAAAEGGVVTMYWRPGCMFCAALRRRMRSAGIPFTEVNIWDDPSAAAFVRSVAGGNETVPTVSVGATAMVNPPVSRVLAEVRRVAPDLVAAAPARGGMLTALRRLLPGPGRRRD
ncbi:MAG: glutaredoxin domain-containing protein [Acidimicrobiales bacterium]